MEQDWAAVDWPAKLKITVRAHDNSCAFQHPHACRLPHLFLLLLLTLSKIVAPVEGEG